MGNPLATPWWTCANLGVGVGVKSLDLRIVASTNCSDPLLFIFSSSRSSSSCILRSITLAVSSTLSFLSLFYFSTSLIALSTFASFIQPSTPGTSLSPALVLTTTLVTSTTSIASSRLDRSSLISSTFPIRFRGALRKRGEEGDESILTFALLESLD